MFKLLRLLWFRHKLRGYAMAYYRELDRYSCGSRVSETVNPRVYDLKNKANGMLDKLSKIDPRCPISRF